MLSYWLFRREIQSLEAFMVSLFFPFLVLKIEDGTKIYALGLNLRRTMRILGTN
jgi:hypothetical protein